MTFKEKLKLEHPDAIDNRRAGGCVGCPFDYDYEDVESGAKNCDSAGGKGCDYCWNREIPEEKVIITERVELTNADDIESLYPRILDSGNRRQFESGAVRDIQEGKGRCDLLPLNVVGGVLNEPVLTHISMFQDDGLVSHLYSVFSYTKRLFTDDYTMILEVAKQFEEGCKKYGENNWRKGIPAHCYIDSAVRHYLKYLRGDKDEPHDRAFVWNILCCVWTCVNKPELNDYMKEDK